MYLLKCFCLTSHPSSFWQLRSLLMSFWVKDVLFCPHGCADDSRITLDGAMGFLWNSNCNCWTIRLAGTGPSPFWLSSTACVEGSPIGRHGFPVCPHAEWISWLSSPLEDILTSFTHMARSRTGTFFPSSGWLDGKSCSVSMFFMMVSAIFFNSIHKNQKIIIYESNESEIGKALKVRNTLMNCHLYDIHGLSEAFGGTRMGNFDIKSTYLLKDGKIWID